MSSRFESVRVEARRHRRMIDLAAFATRRTSRKCQSSATRRLRPQRCRMTRCAAAAWTAANSRSSDRSSGVDLAVSLIDRDRGRGAHGESRAIILVERRRTLQ